MALLLCTTPARVRRGASLTSPLLGELPAGAVVEVQGGADRLLVRWNRRSGYVSAKCFADPDADFAAEGGNALREFGSDAFLAWHYAH